MTARLTIAQAIKKSQMLEKVSDSARIDIEVLLASVLKKNRAYLYTWPEKELTEQENAQFLQWLERRIQGEPVAYITGEKEFWSLSLSVNSSTLIPRPDTELLVETALSLMSDNANPSPTIVDLGTGTGAIALALAQENPHWNIIAVDKQTDACQLAEHNRQKLQLDNVTVVCSDWLQALNTTPVNMVVSNPPYIEYDDPHLIQGDVRFEPHSALTAENNGLADIQVIIEQSSKQLVAGGYLLMEHGYQQAQAVQSLLQQHGYDACFTVNDLAGHPRVTGGQWNQSS